MFGNENDIALCRPWSGWRQTGGEMLPDLDFAHPQSYGEIDRVSNTDGYLSISQTKAPSFFRPDFIGNLTL